MQQASRLIQSNYIDVNVNGRELSQGSITGMVNSLDDPNSQYLSPEEYRSQQDASAGRHRGVIGVSVVLQGGYPVVAGVLPNSPALRAGLATGDAILQVDGRDTLGLTADHSSALLRGAAGTHVHLLVQRGAGRLELEVERQDFQSPTVEADHLPNDLLYLRVFRFGDTTEKEFDSQLHNGLSGARGTILDLRDNPGGRVAAAVTMVSRFVASGEVFEERGRGGQSERVSVDGNHPAANLPLVVLVNQSSASASEIVAGSLQAHDRAALVGTKTFGKGSVQADYALADGGALRLTIQRWYLPDGRSIEGTGLTPDVAVDLPGQRAMFDVVQPARGYAADAQLQQALALLSS